MPPNVLLVVLDSVRARNTSLHGYERETTPFLESFAAESTMYTTARAPGMTSLPSHTSVFTGLAVEEHGAHDSILHGIEPGVTVWERLCEEREYRTGVFSYNTNLVSEGSLREAFEHVERGSDGPFADGRDVKAFHEATDDAYVGDPRQYPAYFRFCLGSDRPARTLANGAVTKLQRRFTSPRLDRLRDPAAGEYADALLEWTENDGPWAACLNLMDAHHTYCPTPEYDLWGGTELQRKQSELSPHPWMVHGDRIPTDEWASFEDLYDGAIRQADAAVGELVRALKRRGEFEETLVVVTSDHGEGFGELSRVRPDVRTVGHVAGLHEHLLHVPLLVSYPGQTDGGVVEELATLARFPSVVEAALENTWRGDEFVPEGPVVASGSNVEDKLKNTERAARFCGDTERFADVVRAVYRREDGETYKYMTWGDDESTVHVEDVHTSERVEHGDPAGEIERAFETLSDAGVVVDRREGHEVSASTRQHLAELGYV